MTLQPTTAEPTAETPSGVVSFTEMQHGTADDYALLDGFERQHAAGLADRLLGVLARLDDSLGGYQITRLEHSLQSATRARLAGAQERNELARERMDYQAPRFARLKGRHENGSAPMAISSFNLFPTPPDLARTLCRFGNVGAAEYQRRGARTKRDGCSSDRNGI